MWPKWRWNAHIWSWKFTWPHGVKNTRIHRKTPIVAWWFDACAVGPKAFALRSHVNGIVDTCADRQTTPQVPRVSMSTFPRRPTAHAQTMKSSPRPLASAEVHEKTHCMEVRINFFFLMNISNRAWWQAGRVWRPSDVTPLTLIGEHKKWCLPLGGRRHEQGMRPWNIMVELCLGPWFD